MNNEEEKKKEETQNEEPQKDRGTVLPSTIGRAGKPNDDGLIKDVWGQVLS